ncbi:LysE/ArgO family amino acid transporter [Aliiroseovarius sp. PTFE2010]|uniref:LysE/ArgO family amino acid transporter n=1 Tax=Aliiroseovarius sp. PTFE2010 TaxID=3417190 RepID=UPI003CF5017A
MDAALTGFLSGLSLILAIGAQNAFVLRQGLRGEHVLAIVLVCAVSDALLIAVGVFGFELATQTAPRFAPVMRVAGAVFLLAYGVLALRRAWAGDTALDPAQTAPQGLMRAVATALALTWANPHVYLDTVLLLGAISTGFPQARAPFAFGAIGASFVFFFALGYGARLLRPIFARPLAWRILDAGIAAIMWAIAVALLRGL